MRAQSSSSSAFRFIPLNFVAVLGQSPNKGRRTIPAIKADPVTRHLHS